MNRPKIFLNWTKLNRPNVLECTSNSSSSQTRLGWVKMWVPSLSLCGFTCNSMTHCRLGHSNQDFLIFFFFVIVHSHLQLWQLHFFLGQLPLLFKMSPKIVFQWKNKTYIYLVAVVNQSQFLAREEQSERETERLRAMMQFERER